VLCSRNDKSRILSTIGFFLLVFSGLNVPLIVQRCIEEVERRGLDIIGLYRLCGSSSKKQILREAFERSPRTVDLSADNVPDINVIAGW
jgi:hypothetical protein